jgi:predicted lipoprotein with Yx(FWY)xxD motif
VNSRQMSHEIERLIGMVPIVNGSPMSTGVVSPALIVVLLLILAACTGQASQEDEATETSATEASSTAVQLTVVVTEPAEEETPIEEPVAAEVGNAVTVEDQALGQGNTVTVAGVIADADGWLVIHAQADGSPGPVLGHSPVTAGENQDVVVEIDAAGATDTLYAMLHIDAGTAGEYEFPGDDGPARDGEGNVVTPPFGLTIPNAVSVFDQALAEGDTVTIAEVIAEVPGWMVIHAQADGSPGPVLGFAPVAAGYNSDVIVEIDATGATDTLYAMLHVDAGSAGEYEFPGDDVPAMDASGSVVTPPFALSGQTGTAESVISLGGTDELGEFLVDANGMTLYLFTVDEPGVSNCYDACAVAWPPLLVEEGITPAAMDGIGGEVGLTERTDGTMQVTYNDRPLYFWISDQQPGDTFGQGVEDVWFVVEP